MLSQGFRRSGGFSWAALSVFLVFSKPYLCISRILIRTWEEGGLGAGAVLSGGFRRSGGFSWAATGRLQGVASLVLCGCDQPTLSCLASPAL